MGKWDEKILSAAEKINKGIDKGTDFIISLKSQPQQIPLQVPLDNNIPGQAVKHCPSCGYAISSLAMFCPACGVSIEDTKASPSAQMLAYNLSVIDSQKEGLIRNFIRNHQGNTSDKAIQKSQMIKAFPIPNTKKDLMEFMHMATSSINANILLDQSDSSIISDDAYRTEKLLSQTWLDKMEAIYQKSKALLFGDPEFSKIESLYTAKKNEIQAIKDAIKKKKKKEFRIVLVTLLLLAITALTLVFFLVIKPNIAKNDELNTLVFEIRQDIADEKYGDALLKTNKVRYKNGTSEDEAKWDLMRETLIKEIEDAQAGE